MTVMQQSLKQHSLRAVLALLALACVPAVAADKAAEPNTQVPLGSTHYVADGFRTGSSPPRRRMPREASQWPGAPMPASLRPGWNWW